MRPAQKTPTSLAAGVRAAAKANSREALIQSAMALIPLKGLDVSLDELCAHAGYTRGAFYQHFDDRDALISAVTQRITDDLLNTVTAHFSGESARDLAGIGRVVLDQIQRGDYPIGRTGAMRSHQLLEACARSDVVRGQYLDVFQRTHSIFSNLVQDAQADGHIPSHLNAGAVSTLAIAMVVGLRTLDEVGAPIDAASLRTLLTDI